jgi:hypothetical protein
MADTTLKSCDAKDQIIKWIEQTQGNNEEWVLLPQIMIAILLISRYRNKTLINFSIDAIEYRSIIESLFQNHRGWVSSPSCIMPECTEMRHSMKIGLKKQKTPYCGGY